MSPKVIAFFVSIIGFISVCRSSIKECPLVSELLRLREGVIVRVNCPVGSQRWDSSCLVELLIYVFRSLSM